MASLLQRVSAALSAAGLDQLPARRSLPIGVAARRMDGAAQLTLARTHTPRTSSTRSIQREFAKMAQTRSYAGANYDRLTEDFLAPLTTGDAEMRTRIRTLRQRARELERNEPYSRRYLSRLEDNVYDHHGMTFTSRAGEWVREKGALALKIDKEDAAVIEKSYTEWRKNAFVTGDMTLNEGGRLALRSCARDGDLFIKPVPYRKNPFGFALQLLEADMCDDYKNELLRSGDGKMERQVRMGVEVDKFFCAEAYWMLKDHPGDQQWWFAQNYNSERYPAEEFIHPFHRTRITQCRDVTWLCAIMRDLKMLDGYDEAAIVAARTGAAKMGFLTREYNSPGAPYTGEEDLDASEGGDNAMDAEPGLIEDLSQSPGIRFEKWDPAYPHEQYAAFVKARLRRIGAALDSSYYAIANDLTEVNFSSIRAGLLEDREHFKATQTWWINHFEGKVFLAWLPIALANGSIKNPVTRISLPFSKLEKFQNHQFRPRRWPWVDPEKDVNASVTAINNRLKSRSEVVEENGQQTFEGVIAEQAEEQKIAEKNGVELPPAEGAVPEPDGDEEGKSVDENGKKTDKADGRKSDAPLNGHRAIEKAPARA